MDPSMSLFNKPLRQVTANNVRLMHISLPAIHLVVLPKKGSQPPAFCYGDKGLALGLGNESGKQKLQPHLPLQIRKQRARQDIRQEARNAKRTAKTGSTKGQRALREGWKYWNEDAHQSRLRSGKHNKGHLPHSALGFLAHRPKKPPHVPRRSSCCVSCSLVVLFPTHISHIFALKPGL